jgi:endonuclease/exonuclease/phosphatase family metal-dependent hydrolase
MQMQKNEIDFSEEKTDEFTEQISPKQVNNGYAILWDTKYFEKKDSDNWHNYSKIIIQRINMKGRIVRYPQIIRLQPKNPPLPKFEIRIINIHLTYSGEGKTYYIRKEDMEKLNKMSISYGPFMPMQYLRVPERMIKRQEELDLCLDIYNDVDNYSEDGIIPYTILVGDFNLDPGKCKEMLNERKDKERRGGKREYIIKMEEKTTLRKKLSHDPYCHKYDHFIGTQKNGKLQFEERIDTLKYFNNNESHYRELSDHVPIKIALSLR